MQANASSLLINVQELLEQSSHSKDHEMEPDSPEVAIDTYLKEPSLAIMIHFQILWSLIIPL